MVTCDELIQISLYTIDKDNDQNFNEPIDTTLIEDEVIAQYCVDSVNRIYSNKRDLEFSIAVNGTLDIHHPITSKIINIITEETDSEVFKNETHSLAHRLFDITPQIAKKGDLLTCLFKQIDKYYFVMLKVDENKILKRGINGRWEVDAGLDILTKIQKASYIEVPIVDDSFERDYLLWNVKALDNISNDSVYWNNGFLSAKYKSDSKINTERFIKVFKSFVRTITEPERQNNIVFAYQSFLRTNDNFGLDEFIGSVFGRNDLFEAERERFRTVLSTASQDRENGFDLVFAFDSNLIQKEYNAKGSYVFDNRLKITPTRPTGQQGTDANFLNDLIRFLEPDENGIMHELIDHDNRKYAKVFYEERRYEYK